MDKKSQSRKIKSKICEKDRETGMVYFREGITVSFFLPMPMTELVDPLLAVFAEYLEIIPDDVLRWASVGATSEEWRPIGKSTIQRCKDQLKPEAVRKRSLTSFELTDGNEGGEAPNYGIIVIGNPYDDEMPKEKNLVQMYFPISDIEKGQVNSFVENICNIGALLPYVSGYASPGLHWAELFSDIAMKKARAIAKRHPGYDVQDNVVSRSDIDNKVRGARWLTFIGPEIIKDLGGLKNLGKRIVEPITLRKVGHGIMIRSGEQPEIGNIPNREDTPNLRTVAKLLEPVTLFEEEALIGREFGDFDDDFLIKWERRFLD